MGLALVSRDGLREADALNAWVAIRQQQTADVHAPLLAADVLDRIEQAGAAKKEKVAAFAETLFSQGGPAVDTIVKLFGRETAERLILHHMYGVE